MLVFLCKHPIYLWGAWGGTSCLFLIITLLHASTTMDALVMKDCGSERQQREPRKPAEAAPWGSETWQGARGGLLSPSSEVGPGELLAGEKPGSRQRRGALGVGGGRKMNVKVSTCHAAPIHTSPPALTPTTKAGMAVSVLRTRLDGVP